MSALKRLLGVPALLLSAATVVFFLIHLIPGDPVAAMLGEGASPNDVRTLRAQLGLDRPIPTQYRLWLVGYTPGERAERKAALGPSFRDQRGVLRGDLGTSILSRRNVLDEILRAVPATFSLALASFAAALLVSVPAGLVGAVTRGRWPDHVLRGLSLVGVSTPNYVSGPLLVLVFSVGLGLLPVSGRESPGSLVLPAVTMGLALAALLSRMIRASVAEELTKPYIQAARARGEGTVSALLRHASRNALPPVLVVAGLQFGSLLTGAVVTETIFSWPGIGRLLVQSIQRRDYPTVQGCVLFIASTYVLVNALVDVLAVAIDPRAAARSTGGAG